MDNIFLFMLYTITVTMVFAVIGFISEKLGGL